VNCETLGRFIYQPCYRLRPSRDGLFARHKLVHFRFGSIQKSLWCTGFTLQRQWDDFLGSQRQFAKCLNDLNQSTIITHLKSRFEISWVDPLKIPLLNQID
jgi:hypothetical protein